MGRVSRAVRRWVRQVVRSGGEGHCWSRHRPCCGLRGVVGRRAASTGSRAWLWPWARSCGSLLFLALALGGARRSGGGGSAGFLSAVRRTRRPQAPDVAMDDVGASSGDSDSGDSEVHPVRSRVLGQGEWTIQDQLAAMRGDMSKSRKQQLARDLTREDIEQCFGMSLEDAARHIGLGRTTFKQVCRREGIQSWPGVVNHIAATRTVPGVGARVFRRNLRRPLLAQELHP